MKFYLKNVFLLLILFLITNSCQFYYDTIEYKKSSVEFLNNIMDGKINESVNLFALEHEGLKQMDKNTLNEGLYQFHTDMISQYGKDVKFTFLEARKHFSNNNNSIPNSTNVNYLFENDKKFGFVKFIYDDNSKKILNVEPEFSNKPLPSMIMFYIILLVGLLIPIFNIYVFNMIRKSQLKRKWLKYIVLIILNFPTIKYFPLEGFDFQFFNFQFLGYGFSYYSIFSNVVIALPIGAIYWFWKLKKLQKEQEYNQFAEQLIED
ncbi:hypothetical protein [Algoriella sp.]|uniref:hypothetical protein n=1 Tax=Algoriella sp. TaxID=1872434 RepID=UPI002FCA3F9A